MPEELSGGSGMKNNSGVEKFSAGYGAGKLGALILALVADSAALKLHEGSVDVVGQITGYGAEERKALMLVLGTDSATFNLRGSVDEIGRVAGYGADEREALKLALLRVDTDAGPRWRLWLALLELWPIGCPG